LDFLISKQEILSRKEKHETYKTAANWCVQNNFKIDALKYYEKIGDYESIVSVLWELFEHMSTEMSLHAVGIFERAPKEIFERVDYFASMHLLALLCLYRQQEFISLAESYEQKFLSLPENDFRNRTLGKIYLFWGCLKWLMSTADNNFEYLSYFSKASDCFAKTPSKIKKIFPVGSWSCVVGSSEAGAPKQSVEAMTHVMTHFSNCVGDTRGLDFLCLGELKFYQNEISAAESLLFQAQESAWGNKQFDIVQRSLFYILRIAILQGDRTKAEQTLKDLKSLLDEENYFRRFVSYDIALGWYHCVIRQQEMVSDWLKGDFSGYHHAYFIENLGNQVKARYFYLKRNYMPLMTYIRDLKQRESILYGRVETLAMEACVRYQMKNKSAAWSALREAYENAAPNDIVMPFIELSKDMRTLTTSALSLTEDPETDMGIPRAWLESIRHKATSYAKNQSMFITEHNLYNSNKKTLSAREQDVLSDLYHGFSQSEIANKRSLSVNTVKMVTKCIYDKLHVHKISDLIRIAAEQGLV
jgi:LuxR family maltose regulon positive regulatory protein